MMTITTIILILSFPSGRLIINEFSFVPFQDYRTGNSLGYSHSSRDIQLSRRTGTLSHTIA
jgi:hypothetical protein